MLSRLNRSCFMRILRRLIRALVLIALVSGNVEPFASAQEVNIPDPNLNAVVRATLQKTVGPLTPQDLLGLTNLLGTFRNITNLQGLGAARNLEMLLLDDNHISALPASNELTNLARLQVLDLSENDFTNLALPNGLTNLVKFRAESGELTRLTLPAGLAKLTELRVGFNRLTNLDLPADLTSLSVLSLFQNQLTNLIVPASLINLSEISVDGNRLPRFSLPAGLTKVVALFLGGNQLTTFTVPADMTNLAALRLENNQLTNLTMFAGLEHLSLLVVSRNHLRRLFLPEGLTSLSVLDLTDNQLTNVTLPPDVAQVIAFFAGGNPLTTLVLSESLAASGLASVVDSFRNQGIEVFTYPLLPQLVRPLALVGAFKFGITGPPGNYSVLSSTNLVTWDAQGTASNPLGSVNFVDPSAHASRTRFYRTLLQSAPSNMVFIPPSTFTMGSPSNDPGRSIFEGPQSTVTLTRGFWIGKYEVTQGEYAAIVGENPSNFPGDLRRPVSSVTWGDATNYCAKLTQRELAAGRISPGSRYRLPTEAEWECAARAGTTTRFSHGDDPDYSSLTNYGWFLDLGHPDLIVHPVGQKTPNAWGLYDMAGNVWEWCQDWYGDQLGGVQVDPAGPASNPIGNKVMRGGAYDYPDSSCRSASRLFFFALFPDSDLGFRVVLDPDSP